MIYIWLVVTGTMEFYDFPIILGIVKSTDELVFFRGYLWANTPNIAELFRVKYGELW